MYRSTTIAESRSEQQLGVELAHLIFHRINNHGFATDMCRNAKEGSITSPRSALKHTRRDRSKFH
jgi:hypothetical protein